MDTEILQVSPEHWGSHHLTRKRRKAALPQKGVGKSPATEAKTPIVIRQSVSQRPTAPKGEGNLSQCLHKLLNGLCAKMRSHFASQAYQGLGAHLTHPRFSEFEYKANFF